MHGHVVLGGDGLGLIQICLLWFQIQTRANSLKLSTKGKVKDKLKGGFNRKVKRKIGGKGKQEEGRLIQLLIQFEGNLF